jgi:hypothetical protein
VCLGIINSTGLNIFKVIVMTGIFELDPSQVGKNGKLSGICFKLLAL